MNHDQDWQPYPVDHSCYICDHTYMVISNHRCTELVFLFLTVINRSNIPSAFLYLILAWLVTTKIRFFALKSKKENVLDRSQNGF